MSRTVTLLKTAIVAAATVAIAAPASAVVIGFASYSPIGNKNNIRYTTGGTSANRANNGVYETVRATTVGRTTTYTPGAVDVKFSFLYPEFAGVVDDITASFTLNAIVTKNSTPSTTTGAFNYSLFNGTFSFVTKAPVNVGPSFGSPQFIDHTYAAGSILLAGQIVNGKLNGTFGTSAGGFIESGLNSTFQFASAFLDFSNVTNIDMSQSLTSVTPLFSLRVPANPNRGLSTFTALSSGTFSSDPLPVINGLALVPEPAVWGMLIVGFGLVGVQTRRRNKTTVAA